jgi:hypothetical protein
LMAPPVSAATRGPTLSITSRATRGSTETVSRELGLPEAVIPLPVWQLTSKTPSSAPRALAVIVGAREGAGRVVRGGAAGGGFAALQAPSSDGAEYSNGWRPQAASLSSTDRHVLVLVQR